MNFCNGQKTMTTHSNTLAWEIPWTEEPGRLQSMGSWRVGLDWAIHFHFSLSCPGEENGKPLQYCCLENPRDGSLVGKLSISNQAVYNCHGLKINIHLAFFKVAFYWEFSPASSWYENLCCHVGGHEFEKTPGDRRGQGRLACCNSWRAKELDSI